MTDEPRTYRTKTGRVLTDADIEALADEAERGYDVERLAKRPGRPRMGSRPQSSFLSACTPTSSLPSRRPQTGTAHR